MYAWWQLPPGFRIRCPMIMCCYRGIDKEGRDLDCDGAVLLVNWQTEVPITDLKDVMGIVPPSVLQQLLDKIADALRTKPMH